MFKSDYNKIFLYCLIIIGILIFQTFIQIPEFILGILTILMVIGFSINWKLKGGLISSFFTTVVIFWKITYPSLLPPLIYFGFAIILSKLTIYSYDQYQLINKKLNFKENLLHSLLEHIPDSIYFKDREHRFIEVSKSKAEHHNLKRKDLIGKSDFDFYPSEEAKKMFRDDTKVIENEEPIIKREEKVTRPDGEIHWISATKVPRYNKDGKIVGTLGISRDITKRKKIENKLKKYATYDSLTGVYNRRIGLTVLEEKKKIADRNNTDLTLCYVDINNLKQVNDTYGHDHGDNLITDIARIIKNEIRKIDTLSRIGGDEFLIVFPDCNVEEAENIIDRINRKFDKINSQDHYPYDIGICTGLVGYSPSNKVSIDKLISVADQKMYKNKNYGEN